MGEMGTQACALWWPSRSPGAIHPASPARLSIAAAAPFASEWRLGLWEWPPGLLGATASSAFTQPPSSHSAARAGGGRQTRSFPPPQPGSKHLCCLEMVQISPCPSSACFSPVLENPEGGKGRGPTAERPLPLPRCRGLLSTRALPSLPCAGQSRAAGLLPGQVSLPCGGSLHS